MTDTANVLPKASLETRKLAGSAEVAYTALVADIKARFEAKDANEATIKHDALIGNLSAKLMLRYNAAKGLTGQARLKRDTFEGEAETLLGGGNSTDKDVVAANKWFNRLRTAAGHPSKEARGGARTVDTKKAAPTVAPGVTVASDTDATNAPAKVGTPVMPKLKALNPKLGALEIGQAVRMAMLKSMNDDPAVYETDDTARKVKELMVNYTSAMYLLGVAADKAETAGKVAKAKAKEVKEI